MRINRGIDSIQSPGRAAQEEYIHYWKDTDSRWLIETAIPWKAVLTEGQLPEDIIEYLDCINGFDVSGADSDTLGPNHRDCQTAWDMDEPNDPNDRTEDNAWTNRSVFGIMTFGYGYCPPSGIDVTLTDNISYYPNPASNSIYFKLDRPSTIKIYTLTGVKVMEVQTTSNVDISNLKRGMYLVEINGEDIVKFIKE